MIKYLNGNQIYFNRKLNLILNKRRIIQNKNSKIIKDILNTVKKKGDRALINYEKKFSNLKIKSTNIKFTINEINKISGRTSFKLKKSIDLAFKRISAFHKKQIYRPYKLQDSYNNKFIYRYSPIENIGVYVPGGTASYPSTVLMNCIPAMVAGVKNIVMTTPVLGKNINPAILYAAKKCGVKEIYKIGGAHSIAALAYGTKTIKKVNKIVGPGNAYVAAAKKEVFGDVGIDMVAGPSEVTIVSDRFSNPDWLASDMIAQAEHDIYAQSILISNNLKLIKSVRVSLNKQIKDLPKSKIASKSLRKYGLAIYAKSSKKILEIVNEIAPEHLEICSKNASSLVKGVTNAGSIFLGKFSPEAMGDYLAGPNHVLPTSGSAKFSSGLSVNDFLKRQSLIKITKTGIERLGSSVINLAQHENLEGHANSIKIRLKKD